MPCRDEEAQMADLSTVFKINQDSQLSPHDACRFRHRTGTSQNMYNKQKHFLGSLSKEKGKPNLNILPHHSKLREEDKKSMPANVSFIMVGEDGGVVYCHNANIEGPTQTSACVANLGPGTPIPRMEGCFYSLMTLLAKEIEVLSSQWEADCLRLGVDNNAVLRIIVKVR